MVSNNIIDNLENTRDDCVKNEKTIQIEKEKEKEDETVIQREALGEPVECSCNEEDAKDVLGPCPKTVPISRKKRIVDMRKSCGALYQRVPSK